MEVIARITTENELNGGIVESMTSSSNLDSHIGAKTFIITKIIVISQGIGRIGRH